MSLFDSVTQKNQLSEEAKAKAARTEELKQTIALAYDQAVEKLEGLPTPMLIMHELYGKVAMLNFKVKNGWPNDGLSVQQVMALKTALPPVEAGIAKGLFTSFMSKVWADRDVDKEGKPRWPQYTSSPVVVKLERMVQYPSTAEVCWIAELAGVLVSVSVKLTRTRGCFEIWADTETHNGVVTRIKRTNVILTGDLREERVPLYISYAGGDHLSIGQRLLYGEQVERLFNRMVELDADYQEKAEQAYAEDLKNPDLLAAYKPSSMGSTAGSKAQEQSLRSIEARREQYLAEKHWPLYTKQHGIETRQGYFEHHSWAKHWLTTQGLQPDPNYLRDGKPYSYGSAWVKPEDEA